MTDQLRAAAYDLILASDALDELPCSCGSRAPCEACRFQTAFVRLQIAFLGKYAVPPAQPGRQRRGGRGDGE